MKTTLCYPLFFLLCCLSTQVAASAGSLTFTQDTGGAISAVFTSGPCPAGEYPTTANLTVTINSTQVLISSNGVVSTPVGPCSPQLYPGFTISALLGHVADGHYTVEWYYNPDDITGSFDVVAGSLAAPAPASSIPAPTLSKIALMALTLLVIVRSLQTLARRRRQTES